MGVEEALGLRDRAERSSTRMVDVVEAMIGFGAGKRGHARQRLALEIEHLRHALEDDGGRRQSGAGLAFRHDRDTRDDGLDRAFVEQPELGEAGQRAPDFADGLVGELVEIRALRAV